MKFKNVSEKVIPMKLDGEWKSVEVGEEIDLPHYIGLRQEGLNEVVLEDSEEVEILSEEELKKLTKDGLNDYAAKMGLDEINSSMKKVDMIASILTYQKSEDSDE